MVISAALALMLQNAMQLFDIIIMFGAGTGLVFILRWFWSRINAWSEITAMFVSGIISLSLNFTSLGAVLFGESLKDGSFQAGVFEEWLQYPFVVLTTTVCWLIVTFSTPKENKKVLFNFYEKTQPGGPGWRKVVNQAKKEGVEIVSDKGEWTVPKGILAVLAGTIMVYGCLFTTGKVIYGEYGNAAMFFSITIVAGFVLLWLWRQIRGKAF